jgi:hypothetical protein
MFVSMSFLLDVGVGLITPDNRISESVDLDHLTYTQCLVSHGGRQVGTSS